MKNLFIAFEGIDASGKATQSRMLSATLKAPLFSFPDYSTPYGKLIKDHLHEKWFTLGGDHLLDAMVFQALQLANRLERAPYLVDAVNTGDVISDRYAVSGEVYGQIDGLPGDYIKQIQMYLPQPDYYFLLDIPVEESFRRRPNRGGDRYEEDFQKLKDVAMLYRKLFKERENQNYVILDGTMDKNILHQNVLEKIDRLNYVAK